MIVATEGFSGYDPNVNPGGIVGSEWQLDWRDHNLNNEFARNHLVFGQDVAYLNLSSASDWRPHAGLVAGDPVIHGYYDGVQLEVQNEGGMGVDHWWPTHGRQREVVNVDLIEIGEEAGFDVGGHLSEAMYPRMVFANPPTYSEQTDPIPAIGYP